ncbi:glycoside hydrolase family 2 TIM barrel-domain containing protein [Clostridium sp.]|uniref:glycoside hydrolase family 2 TIM barrel-domain containing protein n=1 Tax=Clostridium sp. TaxID=1506 RepID=UPI003F3BAD08
MKRRFIAVLLATSMVLVSGNELLLSISNKVNADTQESSEWNGNPEIFEVNREEAHATFVSYESSEAALEDAKKPIAERGVRVDSKYHKLLNGEWSFSFANKPSEREKDFYKNDYDTSNWDKIQVPGNWQTQGYDQIIYTNNIYPWTDVETPEAPFAPTEFNPVGSYKRSFEVPEDWTKDRRVYLSFQGVESAIYIWINGEYVGYGEDSYTAKDYDITDYLKPGENDISVEVYRWSDGSWLEDQDFIRLSGIFRDVFIYSTPEVRMNDFEVVTELDDEYKNAELQLEVDLSNYINSKDTYTVEAMLYDDEYNKVLDTPINMTTDFTNEEKFNDKATRVVLNEKIEIENPKKWSAEKPNLYTLVLSLKDKDGNELEAVNTKVGFREFKVDGKEMLINGKPIVFKGVNRVETDPRDGRAVDIETMIYDIELMKSSNINGIRTAHFPSNPALYELCDEYGLYVMDEANIESNGATDILPTNDPRWTANCIDRVKSMVERDKNHPSVVIWSLGNEAGKGTNHIKMKDWIHENEPSRPVHYQDEGSGGNDEASDMVSFMYSSPKSIENYALSGREKPFVLREFSHSMGNSTGGLAEYMEMFEKYDALAGGFIWDWVDQSIYTPIPEKYVAVDSSENKFEGTLSGGEFTEGKDGKGMKGYMTMSNDKKLNLTNDLTLEAWVKPLGGNSPSVIVAKGDSQFALKENGDVYGNELEFFVFDGKTWVSVKTKDVPSDWKNKWHHVAGTYDGEKLKLYIDGKLVGEKNHTGGIASNNYPISIGGDAETGRRSNMIIDSVRVYDKALTKEELNDTERTPDKNSVLWMDFENGKNVSEGGEYLAYGGDWGDKPNNGNFCANGILAADRTPKPALDDVRYHFQDVEFNEVDLVNGVISIENEFLFNNLSEYDLVWELNKDGEEIESGIMNVDINPRETKEVVIPFTTPENIENTSEYWLNVGFKLKEDSKWKEEGYEIAFEQFKVNFSEFKKEFVDIEKMEALDVNEDDKTIKVTGKNFEIGFNKEEGSIDTYKVDGKDLIVSPIEPDFWRAPTDNDRNNGMASTVWKKARENRTIDDVKVSNTEKVTTIEVDMTLATTIKSSYKNVIQVYGDGSISISSTLNPGSDTLPIIPTIGMEFKMPEEYKNIKWYGRGPGENYIDRNLGSPVDVYDSLVEDQFFPYIKPSETGNKTDVRWLTLTNDSGVGLQVSADNVMEFSALPYTQNELSSKRHTYELNKDDNVVVTLNHKQTGVAGDDSWGSKPRDYAMLYPNKEYNYKFTMRPIDLSTQNPMEENAKELPYSVKENQSVSVGTLKGVKPTLPEKVKLELTNGIKEEVNVVWEDILDDDYNNVGDFVVKGRSVGTEIEVLAKVSVKDILPFDNVEFNTLVGVKPILPSTIEVNYTDNTKENAKVTWEDISNKDFSKEGEVIINGIANVYNTNVDISVKVNVTKGDYLSDLEWSYAQTDWANVERDRSTDGNKISLRDEVGRVFYDKGLGSHANSTIIYNIPEEGYKYFESFVGVDQEIGGDSPSVTFEVHVDGEKVYDSGLMKAHTPQKFVQVNIDGKKELKLVITNGGNGNGGDHADWANAMFVKALEKEENIIVSKPSNLRASEVTNSSLKLTWNPSKEVIGLEEYVIYKDGKILCSVPADNTEYLVQGLRSNSIYGFKVTAKYKNGEESKPVSINVRSLK